MSDLCDRAKVKVWSVGMNCKISLVVNFFSFFFQELIILGSF